MSIGMFGASVAVRFRRSWVPVANGPWIGGMLASINAAVAELSNERCAAWPWRSWWSVIRSAESPAASLCRNCSAAALGMMSHFRRRNHGGLIPIVWFLLPESVDFLDRQGKPGALQAINWILTRFGHEPIAALTPANQESSQRSVTDIFKPG